MGPLTFSDERSGFRNPAKPPRTVSQQVELLRQRGLAFSDAEAVASYLRNENYYRFSGYAREYQRDPQAGDDMLRSGVTFELVAGAAMADEALSQNLLRPLLRVERAIRSQLAYELAMVHGEGAFYLDPTAYISSVGKGPDIVATIEDRLIRSKHRGVRRYVNDKDCSAVPIWVAVEDLTFGTLAQVVTHLDDRAPIDQVAEGLGIKRNQFGSIVGSFAYLRNACAHHSQLWNRYNAVPAPLLIKNSHKRYHPKWSENCLYPTVIALGEVLPKLVPDAEDPARVALGTAIAYLKSDDRYVSGFLEPRPQ